MSNLERYIWIININCIQLAVQLLLQNCNLLHARLHRESSGDGTILAKRQYLISEGNLYSAIVHSYSQIFLFSYCILIIIVYDFYLIYRICIFDLVLIFYLSYFLSIVSILNFTQSFTFPVISSICLRL